MRQIRPSKAVGANGVEWPTNRVKELKLRPKDLVVRITDWMKDKDEPGYDVEVYIGGVYDWNESKSFTLSSGLKPEQAKQQAAHFAGIQIARLL